MRRADPETTFRAALQVGVLAMLIGTISTITPVQKIIETTMTNWATARIAATPISNSSMRSLPPDFIGSLPTPHDPRHLDGKRRGK